MLSDIARPFSTPGPVFYAPPPIYFESPTEDPAYSDPAEIPFEINTGDEPHSPNFARVHPIQKSPQAYRVGKLPSKLAVIKASPTYCMYTCCAKYGCNPFDAMSLGSGSAPRLLPP